jgi:hypothetical protein
MVPIVCMSIWWHRTPTIEASHRPARIGSMNQILHADGTSADGKSRYVMEVTPLAGCPARLAAVVEDTSRS